jgi:hypothetical protein
MRDQLCVLCGKTLHERGFFDTELPDGDPRRGPYHVTCYFERVHVTGRGEYRVSVGAIYGMPVLLMARHYGWLPERLAFGAAGLLVRIAFRLLGQRVRLADRDEYFLDALMQKPWAMSWMTANEPKEKVSI